MSRRLAVIFVAFLLVAPRPASATMITFDFSGTVNQVGSNLLSEFSLGQSVSGLYTFDSNTIGQPFAPGGILDPSITHYPNALSELSAQIGGYHVALGNREQRIFVINNQVFPGAIIDRYLVEVIPPTGANVNNLPIYDFVLSFEDNSATAFNGGSLPHSPLDLNMFPSRGGFIDFVNGQTPSQNRVAFIIDTFTASNTAIPEPSSLIVFGLGTCVLSFARRHRSKNS